MKHCALYYDSCLLIQFSPHHCCSPKKIIRSHEIIGSIYQTSHTPLATPVRKRRVRSLFQIILLVSIKRNQQMRRHLRASRWKKNHNHKKERLRKHTKVFSEYALEIGSGEKNRKFFLDECWWAGCFTRKTLSSVSWLYPHPKKLSFKKWLHQRSN